MKVIIISLMMLTIIRASVFVRDFDSSKVLEFTRKFPFCQVHTDRATIANLLKKHPRQFTVVELEAIEKMETPCASRKKHGFMYPGTYWCGPGTKATYYTQLGVHSKEDSCCREHDNCPSSLEAGQCKGGICNTSSYTRSHCDCDTKFQECLKNTGTETGNTIGAIFFNVAQIVCFKETNCTEEDKIVTVEERADETIKETTSCPFEFTNAETYVASPPFFTFKNKKAFVTNLFLRKLKLLK